MSADGENPAAVISCMIIVLLLGVVKHELIDGALYCKVKGFSNVGDGGRGPPKKLGKYFLGQKSCKIRAFC